jgi:hypothetical protein
MSKTEELTNASQIVDFPDLIHRLMLLLIILILVQSFQINEAF